VKKLFILIILSTVSFSFCANAQDTLKAKLEAEASTFKQKLNNPDLKPEERENVYREIAYSINQLGELHFSKGNYDIATKSFVEADSYIRKVHESALERNKKELAETEPKFAGYLKDSSNKDNKTLSKIFGSLVSLYLSEVISYAQYFGDLEQQKIYLERLAAVSKEIEDIKKIQ
jgi:hypothetical protein